MAIYWSTRFARAGLRFQSDAPGSAALAAKLDPWNAAYRARLSRELEDQSADSGRQLLAATRLDPLNSAWWIGRGVRAEILGDTSSAERFYLEAARVSQLFAPRVTLMNFYSRRQDAAAFWKWTRPALERGYGDVGGTFLLCWRVRPDPAWLLEHAMPDNPGVLRQFLRFVTARAGAPAAAPVARSLLSRPDPDSRNTLLDYCEALLAAGQYAAAREIWKGLPDGQAHGGALLTNPEFDHPLRQRGYDWHTIDSPEVSLAPRDPPGGLTLGFTGKQAESCDLISQIVAIPAAGRYQLSLDYRTEGSADPGISWRVDGPLPSASRLADCLLAGSAEWTNRRCAFPMTGPGFVRAMLYYRRDPGTVRFEGRLAMRHLGLAGVTGGE